MQNLTNLFRNPDLRTVTWVWSGSLVSFFGGALAGLFSWLVGTGPGAGMGAMFLFTCALGTLTCLAGYLSPALRNVERDLLDAM